MTPAARSIYVFGIYLVITGVVILGLPDLLLSLLRLPPVTDPWFRILGVPVTAMGLLHLAAARTEQVPLFRAMVWVRLFPLASFLTLVLLQLAPPVILLFGLADAAGAVWTRLALARPLTRPGAT